MSGVSGVSDPWSPLCIAFVAVKNAFEPERTNQCASRPTSRCSATRLWRSSATPPPYAVALTWAMRFPLSLLARAHEVLRRHARGESAEPRDQGPGVRRAPGPERVRQDHHLALRRGTRIRR